MRADTRSADSPTNVPEFSVSELSFAVKRSIEGSFAHVRVRGELSGFKRAASGHSYFGLKDDKAVLDAVAWRGSLQRLSFRPEDGLEVVCVGRMTTYPGRSKYQLVVDHMEPAGIGALMALLEERKKKFEAEGLFEPARKRPLPYLPELIGIVTSPTGAVIRDILHRLEERYPRHVLVWPVLVQGEGAAEQIARAIEGFSTARPGGPVPRPDLVIVARGGGSIEDLWAFNEEIVVRAAAACSIPLISAVGHETDTTLIDFVSDRRAPTPTAAAEIAVPVRREIEAGIETLAARKITATQRIFDSHRLTLDGLRRGLPHPRDQLRAAGQRLDDLGERLRLRTPADVLRAERQLLDQRTARLAELVRDGLRRGQRELAALDVRLTPSILERQLTERRSALAGPARQLVNAARAAIERDRRRLDAASSLLESLSHMRVLERGYLIARSEASGALVASAKEAAGEQGLSLIFADGEIAVDTRKGSPPPGSRGRKPVRGGTGKAERDEGDGQESLPL